jgi:hypothetical protein
MIPLAVYKIVHLLGIMLMFSALGAVAATAAAGDHSPRLKKIGGLAHGLALLIILVGGFGMLARLGINTGWPLWIWLKLAIWVVFGAATVVARRASDKAIWLLFLLPVLGAVSAWLALYQVGAAAQP